MGDKYKLIIWDADGTLLDTSEGIVAASRYAIEKAGFDVPADEILKTFIGPPIQKTFAEVFNLSDEKAMEMANVFRLRYKEHDLMKAVPYEGILSLTGDVSDMRIKQGVATYKRQDYAEKILANFGFVEYMDMIYGSDYDGILTKQDIIEKVIVESEVEEKDRIVMIGDTDSDLKGASRLGIDFIAVTYGFGFKEYLPPRDVKVARTVDEVRGLLEA